MNSLIEEAEKPKRDFFSHARFDAVCRDKGVRDLFYLGELFVRAADFDGIGPVDEEIPPGRILQMVAVSQRLGEKCLS